MENILDNSMKNKIEAVVNKALENKLFLPIRKMDIVHTLIENEMSDDFVNEHLKNHLREFEPYFPEDIESVKEAKEYLLWCKNVAEKYLRDIEKIDFSDMNYDELDYMLMVVESELLNNEKKFYKAFHLREKVRKACTEKGYTTLAKSDKLREELYHILYETEYSIIYLKNLVDNVFQSIDCIDEDLTRISEKFNEVISEELEIDLKTGSVQELIGYWHYYEHITEKNYAIALRELNREHRTLLELEEYAYEQVCKLLKREEELFVIYNLLPPNIKKYIMEYICFDSEAYGWQGVSIIRAIIESFFAVFVDARREKSNEEFMQMKFLENTAPMFVELIDSIIAVIDANEKMKSAKYVDIAYVLI